MPFTPLQSPATDSGVCGSPIRTDDARRRVVYAALALVLAWLSGYVVVLPVFGSRLQQYFGVGLGQFGLLLSVGMVPAALAGLVTGVGIARWGPGRVLRVALLGLGVGMLVVAAGRWLAVMLVALALIGAFMQVLAIAIPAYLVRLYPGAPRRMMSLNLVAAGVGGIVFPALAEWLLDLSRPAGPVTFSAALHVPFGGLSVVFLLGAVFCRKRAAPGGPPQAPVETEGGRWFRLAPGSLLLILLCSLHGACDVSAFMWLPRVFQSTSFSHLSFRPGYVMAAYSLAYVASRAILSAMPDGLFRRSMLVVPGMLGGGLFLAGLLSRTQELTAAGYVAGAFFFSTEFPAMTAVLADRNKTRFGVALAMIALLSGVGSFLLTNVMGQVGDAMGGGRLWCVLLIPALGFPIVGIGGLVWLVRFGRRSPPGQ